MQKITDKNGLMGVIMPDIPKVKDGVSSLEEVEWITNGHWIYRSSRVVIPAEGQRKFGAHENWATGHRFVLKTESLKPLLFPSNIDEFEEAEITLCMAVNPHAPARKDKWSARLILAGDRKFAWVNEAFLVDDSYLWAPSIAGPLGPVIFYDNRIDGNIMAVVMPIRSDGEFLQTAMKAGRAVKAFEAKQKKKRK